jgi:hypothetical protein
MASAGCGGASADTDAGPDTNADPRASADGRLHDA